MIIFQNANILLSAQPYSIMGKFWAGGLSIENQLNYNYQLGYIPTLSANKKLSNVSMLDLEWAYRFDRQYIGDSLVENHDNLYRGWIRYAAQAIEIRLGLQKVSFGPAQVLRPLAWFDTIDPKDPTENTDGVEAFRIRFFPSSSLALWGWVINDESDTLSYGGRGELSTRLGEWGYTLHYAPDDSYTQFGMDFRYDGYLGFWFEGVGSISDSQNKSQDREALITLGSDYTFPMGTGLMLMLETMRIEKWSSKMDTNSNHTISALMGSYPIGMLHNIMLISTLDWDKNTAYNYLRWSSKYDHFSINYIISINPSNIGNSLQLMLIYNH